LTLQAPRITLYASRSCPSPPIPHSALSIPNFRDNRARFSHYLAKGPSWQMNHHQCLLAGKPDRLKEERGLVPLTL
jgi:hypothetical protein